MIPILYIVIFSILLTGIINRVRAVMAGRRGYRLLQHVYTVGVLLRKGAVYSNTSTFLTKLAGPLALASAVGAALCVPLGGYSAVVAFQGDIVLFVSLLAVGRVALILGAMDSGSAFAGMGSAREALFGVWAEPAIYMLLASVAIATGNYSLTELFETFDNVTINIFVLSTLVAYGIFKLALVECARVPIDDTRTHLELTMVHEAMVLDLSGVDLAFVNIASWIKMAIFALLVGDVLIPTDLPVWQTAVLYTAAGLVFAFVIGMIESFSARNRMPRNVVYLTVTVAVAVLALLVAYLTKSIDINLILNA